MRAGMMNEGGSETRPYYYNNPTTTPLFAFYAFIIAAV